MRDYSVYGKCKNKTIKVLSIYNNALCHSAKLFFTTINPGDMGPLDVAEFSDLDGSVSICPKVLCACLVT